MYHAIGQLLQQEHTLGDIIDMIGELGCDYQGRRILKVVRVHLAARGLLLLEELEIMLVRANEVLGHHGDIWQRQRHLQLRIRDAHICQLSAGNIIVIFIIRCACLSLEILLLCASVFALSFRLADRSLLLFGISLSVSLLRLA